MALMGYALLLCGFSQGPTVLELQGEVKGNDVLLAGTLEGDTDDVPVFRAVWRGVPGGNAVFQVLPAGEAPKGLRLMLDRLVEVGLGTYLDAHLRFERDGVVADRSAAQMTLEMDAMVMSAANDLGAPHAFSGFSPSTREQLDRLSRIDWSQARFGVDGGAEQDKYLAIYFYVRSQRNELERQMRADLLPLANVPVFAPADMPFGAMVQVNSTCGTVFDEENFLCALDLQLADTGGGGIDPELGESIMQTIALRSAVADVPVTGPHQVRKRDRWLKAELDDINTRIDRMDQRKELWAMRDRMDDIEDRITGLGLEVQDLREQSNAGNDNPLAELSELTGSNITVRFQRNITIIDTENRALLDEVFEQLVRTTQERIVISGYTDRSGDPKVNLALSEQRAKVVRNYFLERGIPQERLMMNYYGDTRSAGRDPEERRVEVEWLH